MKAKSILGHIARTLLGLVFIFSGGVKAIDPLGTTYKIEDYLKAFGGWFNNLLPMAETATICLIAVEVVLGLCLLFNVRIKLTAWLTLFFYLVMTPLTLYIAITNPISDCGCFGDALVLTNWQTFFKNIILLALVITLLVCCKAIHSTFVWQAELGIASLALILAVGFMYYNLTHLPVIDFRPYKVGNNIKELMEYPEDAGPDQYEIKLVYEKNGIEQEFDLTDYPKDDTTWTFIRQNSKLIKKGYEPPIHDFVILQMGYEDEYENAYYEDYQEEEYGFGDITYDILESEAPVTLVIMYDLNKADMDVLDQVTDLYLQCLERGEEFYILTGSGEQDVENFCQKAEKDNRSNCVTPFNHPNGIFCFCDPVTLKTIVRANPGVIVVQKGTIIDKFRFY